jgi:hypothetical protein
MNENPLKKIEYVGNIKSRFIDTINDNLNEIFMIGLEYLIIGTILRGFSEHSNEPSYFVGGKFE